MLLELDSSIILSLFSWTFSLLRAHHLNSKCLNPKKVTQWVVHPYSLSPSLPDLTQYCYPSVIFGSNIVDYTCSVPCDRFYEHKPSSMERCSWAYHQYDEAEVFLGSFLFDDKYDSGHLTNPSKWVSLRVVARTMFRPPLILGGHPLMKSDVSAS